MALGGGKFTVQDKVLPGAYINFVSTKRAGSQLSDRGIAAMALDLDWGKSGEVITITAEDFIKNSMRLFGYDYGHDKLKGLRDLFLNINTLHLYRLNTGGVKASNTYATAKHSGTRGNDIKIVIRQNVDVTSNFDVLTYLGTLLVDKQTVKNANELKSNDYVDFKSASLQVVASAPLTSGTNGTVETSAHQTFLDKIEAYHFNAIGYVGNNSSIANLYAAFTKRMRDEVGAKFQAVLYNTKADYEGVVNVKNQCEGDETALAYWVTGIIAGCEVNKSNLNRKYDGEFKVKADFTQAQLTAAIKAGEFTLHKVGTDIRVLEDINSLTATTEEKGEDFKNNQVIRVIDQIANDIAVLFNTKYNGNIQNNEAGRISLWADIVKHHERLQEIGAIENFTDKDVEVTAGETKKAVSVIDRVSVTVAMAQLYMVVKVA